MKDVINEKYKYSELTGKIIGCSMEVHKILGNGFQEVIYQRALQEEFILQGVSAFREFEMCIFYKGKIIGTRRVDFFVGDAVSLEIKALIKLEDVHLAQAINYLEAYNLEIGMLINFGTKSLEYKRLINSKFDPAKLNTSVKSKQST
ncbi:MAG: GxxExxY protein [Bacteroidetes bacterium]|nr:GxxExxY protein [Bacteroidota bacterium]